MTCIWNRRSESEVRHIMFPAKCQIHGRESLPSFHRERRYPSLAKEISQGVTVSSLGINQGRRREGRICIELRDPNAHASR
jgi:hypothetical protein